MKLISKPISSPNRLDKFPTPLMLRFLRNNGGSRSRGRSRSSPIFIRRRNEASSTSEGPEPSSPKVTCMGQVRVSRSKIKSKTEQKRRPCFWLRRALFCDFSGFLKPSKRPRTPKLVWKRLVAFCQMGFGGGVQKVEKSSKSSETEQKTEGFISDSTEEEKQRNDEAQTYAPNSPPKNALFLMRCKSAPSRPSSLAYRFWGSPKTEQFESDPETQEEEEEEEEEQQQQQQQLQEPNCSRRDGEGEEEKSKSDRERENRGVVSVEVGRAVMVLPRCKSEPARIATERMMDLTESWRLSRFEIPTTATRFFD
ncbi:hypothetical protein Sjap_013926 [Stephania japonica]|uniref:Uncharacterized protein n=1 Tax=Stephania japonica TaxID=461633 RepID=A0AAP0IYT1_9MAGN